MAYLFLLPLTYGLYVVLPPVRRVNRVVVTNLFVGVCHMQVCAVADATDEEILEACNRENPAGTSAGWATVCRSADDFWGKTAPVACADDSSRLHFLVAC
jgi:hypothetical protein